jgi:hypothetical protein
MIELYNFEVVTEFIYLRTLINCKNDLEEEIKRGIIIGNRCYNSMSELLKSQLLKRKTKCQLYKTVNTSNSTLWTLSKAHEAQLGGFVRKILRRICGAVQINGVWRRRNNKELYSLFNNVGIIERIKIGQNML